MCSSFSGVVLLLKRVLNAPYLAVVFLTRDVSSLFDFPSPWIGFVGERERERETTEEDGRFGVPWTLGGVRFVSKSWIKDKNETL